MYCMSVMLRNANFLFPANLELDSALNCTTVKNTIQGDHKIIEWYI